MKWRTGKTFFVVAPLLCAIAACSDTTGPARTASGLQIWADVTPAALSISDTTAAFAIRIHIYNPSWHTITRPGGPPYVFTSDPAQSRGLEECFRIANATSEINAGPNSCGWGQAQYVFPPHWGEYALDSVKLKEWKAGGWPLVPGQYRIRSWFNAEEGSSAVFTLFP
jgi:hypothetical protein